MKKPNKNAPCGTGIPTKGQNKIITYIVTGSKEKVKE